MKPSKEIIKVSKFVLNIMIEAVLVIKHMCMLQVKSNKCLIFYGIHILHFNLSIICFLPLEEQQTSIKNFKNFLSEKK